MTQRPSPTRRAILATGAAALATPAFGAVVDARLRAEGAERQLPSRMLGFNTPANYAIPSEDPAFGPAVKSLEPHYLRFPGGTVANYYNWKTGQLDVADIPNGSIYRKFLVEGAVPNSRKLHPNGVHWDKFRRFAEAADCDVIMLPNLETSSVENERARFADMARKGGVPKNIEMGNEFYLAALMDPLTLSIFPDYATAMTRTKQYLDAIRPSLPKDAKVAVQAASTRLHHPHRGDDARSLHERQWDDAMKPEPWFDAVTSHLYPTLSSAAGGDAAQHVEERANQIYPAMIARADEGYERSLADTAARMPGKEIWVTEWGGFDPAGTFSGVKLTFDGMWLHQVTRCMLAQLRRPEVTVSNYHALFVREDLTSIFRVGPGTGPEKYVPVTAASVLHWFFAAARGPDSHYQRIMVDGARRITANGSIPGEGFGDVEACLFRQGRTRTLFVHNAWNMIRGVDLSGLIGEGVPRQGAVIATPDLLEGYQRLTPQASAIAVSQVLNAPAYSLTRVTWTV